MCGSFCRKNNLPEKRPLRSGRSGYAGRMINSLDMGHRRCHSPAAGPAHDVPGAVATRRGLRRRFLHLREDDRDFLPADVQGEAPRLENVEFHPTVTEALHAGFRPCRLCRPMAAGKPVPSLVEKLRRAAEAAPDGRVSDKDLAAMGRRCLDRAPPVQGLSRHDVSRLPARAAHGPGVARREGRQAGRRGAGGARLRIDQRFSRGVCPRVRHAASAGRRQRRCCSRAGSRRRSARC